VICEGGQVPFELCDPLLTDRFTVEAMNGSEKRFEFKGEKLGKKTNKMFLCSVDMNQVRFDSFIKQSGFADHKKSVKAFFADYVCRYTGHFKFLFQKTIIKKNTVALDISFF